MKCADRETCKSDEEIAAFARAHSFIFMHNQAQYLPQMYGDGSIRHTMNIPESHKLDGTQYDFDLQINQLTSQESYLGLTFLSDNIEKTFYRYERARSYPSMNEHIFLGLTIFESEDIVFYERKIYNALDLLGDIGGLVDALCYIATALLFLLSLVTGDGPFIPIIKRLFKVPYRSS